MRDKLPNEVNHFAAKTLSAVARTAIDGFLMNLLLLVFFGVLTYMGYSRGVFILLVMSFPCLIGISLVVLYDLYLKIKEKYYPD